MNLPNKLTLFRFFLLVPTLIVMSLFVVEINKNSSIFIYFIILCSIFIVAMITDLADGYLARKHNQITNFGMLFDPIADKFMINATLIFLATINITPIWIVVPFILRDIFVDGCRNIAAKNNVKIAASIYGKIKTLTQTIAIIFIYIVVPFINYDFQNANVSKMFLINIPIFVALFFSIISSIDYFWKIKKLIYK